MPARVPLAVLGVGVVLAAGLVAGLTAAVSGSQGAARDPSARPPLASAAVSAPAVSAPAVSAPGIPATAAGRRDPLGAAAAYLSARAGTVLAAVYDVGTGQTWRLGQGRPQAEASVVKLDILEALLAKRGTSLSAGDRSLAEQMIEDSDNTAATSLWNELGGPAGIASFNAKAGLTSTVLSSCVACAGFSWPGWGLTTTTPDDQIALLEQLVTASSVLTRTERGYALSLMENVTPAQRWGISSGVPAGVTVALKNGWLPLRDDDGDWQVNSVGWVSGDGRDYLMAVLTTGNPSARYGVDTIERLAAIVWQGMR